MERSFVGGDGGGGTIHPAMGVRQSVLLFFFVFVKECRNMIVERVRRQGRHS